MILDSRFISNFIPNGALSLVFQKYVCRRTLSRRQRVDFGAPPQTWEQYSKEGRDNLLSDHQYDFRKARSTGDLLADAVHVWSSALESCGESRVISIDISKAFDRVWHKGLLAKLSMFGLHHILIKWIGSFLSDRSIAVRVDGFLSNLHSINAGVSQGSVISLYSSSSSSMTTNPTRVPVWN